MHLIFVHNDVKLKICFVMRERAGVIFMVLCAVDTGYGLGRSLGDYRPALPETKSHNRRSIADLGFLFL